MKSVFEFSGPKHTTAWLILYQGKAAGKLIAAHGSSVTCSIFLYAGPLCPNYSIHGTGHAGGYGYCKLSAACSDAITRAVALRYPLPDAPANLPRPEKMSGAGESKMREYFETRGYVVEVVC